MMIRRLYPLVIILLLSAACGAPSSPAMEVETADIPAEAVETAAPVEEPTQVVEGTPAGNEIPAAETAGPDCLGDEISPVGQAIADDYEFTDYEQVMDWFCNGAEFEDILVALETEAQTGTPTDEMLQMLADDFTWEEIWQLIGLIE